MENISFDNMDVDESAGTYLFFYHTERHELYMPDNDITELPEHIVVLEIPNELKLDPVAVAREHNKNEHEVVLDHPIREGLAARVIPLSESGLPELISHNLKSLKKG